MRDKLLLLWTVAAAQALASLSAQAMTFAAPSGLRTAIGQASPGEEAGYICRQGTNGRRCYQASRSGRSGRSGYNPYVPYPYNLPRTGGDPPYNTYYWGGPMGEGG
jgi:hypothetical protein